MKREAFILVKDLAKMPEFKAAYEREQKQKVRIRRHDNRNPNKKSYYRLMVKSVIVMKESGMSILEIALVLGLNTNLVRRMWRQR